MKKKPINEVDLTQHIPPATNTNLGLLGSAFYDCRIRCKLNIEEYILLYPLNTSDPRFFGIIYQDKVSEPNQYASIISSHMTSIGFYTNVITLTGNNQSFRKVTYNGVSYLAVKKGANFITLAYALILRVSAPPFAVPVSELSEIENINVVYK